MNMIHYTNGRAAGRDAPTEKGLLLRYPREPVKTGNISQFSDVGKQNKRADRKQGKKKKLEIRVRLAKVIWTNCQRMNWFSIILSSHRNLV